MFLTLQMLPIWVEIWAFLGTGMGNSVSLRKGTWLWGGEMPHRPAEPLRVSVPHSRGTWGEEPEFLLEENCWSWKQSLQARG